LDVFKTDVEQVESIHKWWNENGKSVVTGVLLGLLAIFGWRAWQDYERQQAETASQLYQNILDSIGNDTSTASAGKEVNVISDKLIEDYGKTGYAVLVKLIDARLAVDAREYTAAEGHLKWALDHNKVDSLGHMIRLRLAKVLAMQKKYDEAITLLKTGNQGEFSASYAEAQADILKTQGNLEGARKLYQEALAKRKAAKLETGVLELKLDDLGGSAE